MKQLLFTVLTFSVFALSAQDAPVFEEPVNGPKIKFLETQFDFGDIEQGEVVEHVFAFENTGNQPLVLSNVMTTCGCTVPAWPREPIAPGANGELKVKFNSRGKIGIQNKVITIVSNAVNQRERIKIVTNVKMPQTEG
jgi:hypothetical protein